MSLLHNTKCYFFSLGSSFHQRIDRLKQNNQLHFCINHSSKLVISLSSSNAELSLLSNYVILAQSQSATCDKNVFPWNMYILSIILMNLFMFNIL